MFNNEYAKFWVSALGSVCTVLLGVLLDGPWHLALTCVSGIVTMFLTWRVPAPGYVGPPKDDDDGAI
jgi:hypothetical protein